MNYSDILVINNQPLTKKYIESLSKQERLDLIDPIFSLLREIGMLYPDNIDKVDSEYKKLVELQPDLSTDEVYNNSSLGTNICQFFCKDFFKANEANKKNMFENFADDKILKRIIANRLGLDWIDDNDKGKGVNEAFNLTFKMIFFQAQRSMRLVNATSMFKPSIAKYMYMKYSNEQDTVFDYSVGWGGRMLGASSCNRKYIGSDPLTVPDVQTMIDHLKIKNCKLIHSGSEYVKLDEDSIDFIFSSPPYFDQEVYSYDKTQAYNNGEDYFYNVYWRQTLQNAKFMLKPNKWFGLNITNKYERMINMAKEEFGDVVELVKLKTVKNHLHKKTKEAEVIKFEPVFMFRNNK